MSVRDQLKDEIKAEIRSSMEKDLIKEQVIKELREQFDVHTKINPIFLLFMFSILGFLVLEGLHRVFLK